MPLKGVSPYREGRVKEMFVIPKNRTFFICSVFQKIEMNQAGITDEEYGNMTMEEYFTKKAAAVEDV